MSQKACHAQIVSIGKVVHGAIGRIGRLELFGPFHFDQRVAELFRLVQHVGRYVVGPFVLVALWNVVGFADMFWKSSHVFFLELWTLGRCYDLVVTAHTTNHIIEQLTAVFIKHVKWFVNSWILVVDQNGTLFELKLKNIINPSKKILWNLCNVHL